MHVSRIVGAMVAAISLSLVACAPPEPTPGSLRSALDGDDGDDGAGDDGAKTKAKTPTRTSAPSTTPAATSGDVTAPTTRPAPPTLSVSFLASAKQKFDGMAIGRQCSDLASDWQNATFMDGTYMQLISVDNGAVLATADGALLQTMKTQMIANGEFTLPVNPKNLSSKPYEYAIIMGGDDRFGSPAVCGSTLKPSSGDGRDARNFPNNDTIIFGTKLAGTGCGIVGYVVAYYDQAQQKVVAQASSQILLSAWDGKSGFPGAYDKHACDVNNSPLVLDLGNHGVALSAPTTTVFDVDGDGSRDDSPWVVSHDTPFLVRDANLNGTVDGIDEMFGNRTLSPSGLRDSQNGFDALGRWDANADGKIDASDKVWSSLRLWFDKNHDGRTDPGELETLESRGVQSVSLSFTPVTEYLWVDNQLQGAVRQRGAATMTDGRAVNVVDVWFDGQ